MTRSRTVTWAALIVWAGFVLALCGYVLRRPVPDADMIMYAGVALELRGVSDPVERHRRAYEDIRLSVDDALYASLLGQNGGFGGSYRAAIAADPGAFEEQLPFYRVKPLLPTLIAIVSLTGLTMTQSALLISLGSFLVLACLLLWGLWDRQRPFWSVILAGGLVAIPPLITVATFTSPDALSNALLAGAFLVSLKGHRVRLGLAILLISVVARPNNAALVVVWLLYLGLVGNLGLSIRRPEVLAWGIGVVGVFLALSVASRNYSFPTLFYFANVEYLAHPAAGAPPLGIIDFLQIYASNSLALPLTLMPIYALMGILVLRLREASRALLRVDPLIALVVTAFVSMALQWLYYPLESDRILSGGCLMIGLALVACVSGVAWGQARGRLETGGGLPAGAAG